MLRITYPPATAPVMAEHPLATAGRHLARYGLVAVIAWIGALKYTSYQAAAIQSLIAHSTVFSWIYGVVSVRVFAAALGTVEIIAALLIALRAGVAAAVRGRQRHRRAAVRQHAELPVHHAGSNGGRRAPGAVGAARPAPAQRPRLVRRGAVDPGRLTRRRLRAARRAAQLMAVDGRPRRAAGEHRAGHRMRPGMLRRRVRQYGNGRPPGGT